MNMLHRTIGLPNESTPRAVAIQYWSRFATVSIAGALILTAGRVMWLKTNPSDALEASMTRKNGQSVHERTLAEPFPRGTIYDRRGQVVAMDTTVGSSTAIRKLSIAKHKKRLKNGSARVSRRKARCSRKARSRRRSILSATSPRALQQQSVRIQPMS